MAEGKEKKVKEKKADELFQEFKEVSITEFFRKNKAHLGYSGKVRSLTTIVHELVTNALDACEEAGMLPDVKLQLKALGPEHYQFTCEDNGPGIPPKHISNVFGKMLAGTKFHRNIQLRGQQGIGVAGVTLYSQITTGKPVKIKTCTGDHKIHEIKLLVDVQKNKADIVETNFYEAAWQGTEIQGEVKGVQYQLSDRGPHEYLRRTAIANPHASITFIDPEGRKTVFKRVSDKIPKQPVEVKPHPKGIDVDELLAMAKMNKNRQVSSFLSGTFARMSSAKVKDIQEKCSFDLKKNPRRLQWAEAEEIVHAINDMDFMAPPTEGLSPIGQDQVEKAVLGILKPEFSSVLTRNPTTHSGGTPFQVEVAIAYGGEAGRSAGEGRRAETMRFANRTPLLFDAGGCALHQAVQSVDWKRYGVRDFDNSPITVFVNLVSTYVPYTSAGKQSVSNDVDVLREVRFALMDVGRRFSRYHSKKRRDIENEARLNTLLKYSTELAPTVALITGGDAKKLSKKLEDTIRTKLKLEAMEGALDAEDEEAPPKSEAFVEGKEESGKEESGKEETGEEEISEEEAKK